MGEKAQSEKDVPVEEEHQSSDNFARDLFDQFGANDTFYNRKTQEIINSESAKQYFLEKYNNPKGRREIYREILAQDYSKIFQSGFSVTNLNQNFKGMPKAEKALVLQGVLECLNLNLKDYSSKAKKIRFEKMKQSESLVL